MVVLAAAAAGAAAARQQQQRQQQRQQQQRHCTYSNGRRARMSARSPNTKNTLYTAAQNGRSPHSYHARYAHACVTMLMSDQLFWLASARRNARDGARRHCRTTCSSRWRHVRARPIGVLVGRESA